MIPMIAGRQVSFSISRKEIRKQQEKYKKQENPAAHTQEAKCEKSPMLSILEMAVVYAKTRATKTSPNNVAATWARAEEPDSMIQKPPKSKP
ncbi:MAG: hypothetical protein L7F78_11430, partial [Syntrophales bacterium LBB04]|nr:hypothetical protein [Syntrophales bacterium LBB04]